MSLGRILHAMFFKAIRHLGERVKTELPNGLHIELYVDNEHTNHLLLWRRHGRPSVGEWDTVLARWPQVLPDPKPEPRELGEHALTATWKAPVPVFGEKEKA